MATSLPVGLAFSKGITIRLKKGQAVRYEKDHYTNGATIKCQCYAETDDGDQDEFIISIIMSNKKHMEKFFRMFT